MLGQRLIPGLSPQVDCSMTPPPRSEWHNHLEIRPSRRGALTLRSSRWWSIRAHTPEARLYLNGKSGTARMQTLFPNPVWESKFQQLNRKMFPIRRLRWFDLVPHRRISSKTHVSFPPLSLLSPRCCAFFFFSVTEGILDKFAYWKILSFTTELLSLPSLVHPHKTSSSTSQL